MAINKILDKNKNVILDLTADTVDSTHLAAGYTAHNKHGQIVVGTLGQKDYVIRGENTVTFYDWYGNSIYTYTKAEFLELTELPPLPEFSEEIKNYYRSTYNSYKYTSDYPDSGAMWPIIYFLDDIVVDRWSNTLEELKQALLDGMDGAQVSALYKMKDDCTMLMCTTNRLTETSYNTLKINFSQSVAHGVEVDWGDGSPIETFATFGNNNIKASHKYTWYGKSHRPYIVKFKVKEGKLGFGYRQKRNWDTGEYLSNYYGSSYVLDQSGYYTCSVFFGKDVELGYIQQSHSWGGFEAVFGGLHEISFDKQEYSNNSIQLYYLQPVLIATSNLTSRLQDCANYCIYKLSAGRLVFQVNCEPPLNIPTSDGWVYGYTTKSFTKFNDATYLPLSWSDGAWIRPYSDISVPKYIYPPNFKPKSIYDCASQETTFTQSKVIGYLQDGIPDSAKYCFANTPSLTKFTCPYNIDFPMLASYLFTNCGNLTSIIFEDGYTTLPTGICYNCTNLKYVYIPASVNKIESSAFSSSHESLIIEIEPNISGRTYNGTWMTPKNMSKIYYNGTWQDWLSEMLYGDQPSDYSGLSYITYVLNESGDIEYKGRRYKKLLEEEIPSTYSLPIGKEKISLSWLSYFPKIKDLHIIPAGLTTITQMPSYFTCALDGVYFDGPITQWLELKFSNTDSQSSNPMSCAEHLYILDVSGSISKDGKTYSEVTEITAPTAVSDGVVYVKGYCLHGYNGGVHKIVIPEGVVKLSNYAIRYNRAVTEIVLPESLQRLEYGALQSNYRLSEISFPKNVNYIGNYCFDYCYNLSRVVFNQEKLPTIESRAFCDYCTHLYEIENHTSTNLSSYVGSSSLGYLCYYAKHIITSKEESKLVTDEYNNLLYKSGNDCHYLAYLGNDGNLVFPNNITYLPTGSYKSIYLDNNVKNIVYPDKTNFTIDNSSHQELTSCYHLEELKLGSIVAVTKQFSSPLLNKIIKDSNSSSPFCRSSDYRHCYSFSPITNFIIGPKTKSLSQAIYTDNSHYVGCSKVILEPSTELLKWDKKIPYYAFAQVDSEVDFSARPVDVNYSDWLLSQDYSVYLRDDLKLKTLKLNCGTTFNSSYGLMHFVQDIDKVILSGTGLTKIEYYLLRGEMPNLSYLELPASLTSIKGNFLAQFPIDHKFTLTFNSVTPPTMTSNFITQSNILQPENLTIRVPQGSLEAYSTATNWPTIDQVTYVEYDLTTGEDIVKGE